MLTKKSSPQGQSCPMLAQQWGSSSRGFVRNLALVPGHGLKQWQIKRPLNIVTRTTVKKCTSHPTPPPPHTHQRKHSQAQNSTNTLNHVCYTNTYSCYMHLAKIFVQLTVSDNYLQYMQLSKIACTDYLLLSSALMYYMYLLQLFTHQSAWAWSEPWTDGMILGTADPAPS